MPQVNYTPIQLYRSGTTGATPSAGLLQNGELAINYADGKLFYKDGAGTVRTVVTPDGSVTTAKIVDANVTTAKIADANVTTAKIADANVTTAKLAAGAAVANIGAGGITVNELAADSVTTTSISDANVTPAKLSQPFTRGTAVASTSGTSINFTSIPSWAKRVTVMFSGVSTSGTSAVLIQLGSGSVEATGYLSATTATATGSLTTNYTTGFSSDFGSGNTATAVRHGALAVTNIGSNIWAASGCFGLSNAAYTCVIGGSKTLSGALDRIRITTVNGTDTFDAGTINIMWE